MRRPRKLKRSTRLTTLLAVGLVSSVLLSGLAIGAPGLVTSLGEVLFNRVMPDGPDDRVIDERVVEFIDGARPGSEIRVSMYLFNSQQTEDALVAAARRGVSVRAATNYGSGHSNGFQRIQGRLSGADAQRFKVVYCGGSCIGTSRGINHQKFWLFSAVQLPGESRIRNNTVFETSQNIHTGQAGEVNNAFIRSDDATLYNGYRSYFELQFGRSKPGSVTTTVSSSDRNGDKLPDIKVWFSPRPLGPDGKLVDFVVNDLNSDAINCAGGGVVRLSGAWFWERPTLRAKLVDLKKAGCDVRVVIRENQELDASNDQGNIDELAVGGVPIYSTRPGGCRYPVASCSRGASHSKYLLLQWKDKAGKARRVVYNGSANWTGGAIVSNDETVAKFPWAGSPAAVGTAATKFYDRYVTDFEQLKRDTININPQRYGTDTIRRFQLVDPSLPGDQRQPVMAASSSGYLAVAWEEQAKFAKTNAWTTDVYFRLYRNGKAHTPVMKLSRGATAGSTKWSHVAPSVAIDGAGNSVVAWRNDSDGNGYGDISMVLVKPRAAGTTALVAALPRPHAAGPGHQTEPSVAMNQAGELAVAWQTVDAAKRPDVAFSRYKRSGDKFVVVSSLREKDVARMSGSSGAYSHSQPDVGMAGDGTVTVAWAADNNGDRAAGIRVSRYSATGAELVSAVDVSDNNAAHSTRPRVAVNAGGQSVVVWQGKNVSTGTLSAYVRTGNASGGLGRTKQVVDPEGTGIPGVGDGSNRKVVGPQSLPDVDIDASGRIVVTWREDEPWLRPAGARIRGDVWARGFTFDLSTAKEGSNVFPSHRMNVFATNEQGFPAVAVHPTTGVLAVAYADDYNSESGGEADLRLRYGFKNAK